MKKNSHRFPPPCLVLVAGLVFSLGFIPSLQAQDESVGIQNSMSPEQFKAAGLEKLTPAELAKLNAWLQGYRDQEVAKVEKSSARREKQAKLSLIVSRVDGTWNGIAPGEIISLEDGSKWKLANKDEHYGGFADHPAVAVYKAGFFGWKMRVSRIAEFYVNQVK